MNMIFSQFKSPYRPINTNSKTEKLRNGANYIQNFLNLQQLSGQNPLQFSAKPPEFISPHKAATTNGCPCLIFLQPEQIPQFTATSNPRVKISEPEDSNFTKSKVPPIDFVHVTTVATELPVEVKSDDLTGIRTG